MALNLSRLRFENPVLTKELRTRMRGARAYWILFVYLLLLSLILFFTYMTWWQSQRGDDMGAGQAAFSVGKMFYLVVLCTQSVLVGLITPALTAGSISIEREQRTYEMLSASLLPRRSIVAGKLWAASAFVGLLLTASLPLVSLCFLLGGVSPGEVFASYGLLLTVAFVYGGVGVAWSAIARKTATATVVSYGTIFLLFVLTFPLAAATFDRPFGGQGFGGGLGALNPVGAVFGGTLAERYFGFSLPAWLPALLVNGLLGVILMVVATHRLEYPASDRSGPLRVLSALFVGLLAFFVYGCLLPTGATGGAAQRVFGMARLEERFALLAIITVMATILWVPIFATGDGLPRRGGLLAGLDPRRLARGEAPSGALFGVLLAALCGAILWLGAPAGVKPNVLYLLGLVGALTFGFGALGLFFSALLNNRWGALALTMACMVLLYLLPLTVLVNSDGRRPLSRPMDNLIYLSPIGGAYQTSDSNDKDFQTTALRLAFGRTPLFAVTSVLYTAFGVVLLGATGIVQAARARERRRDETAKSLPPPQPPAPAFPATAA